MNERREKITRSLLPTKFRSQRVKGSNPEIMVDRGVLLSGRGDPIMKRSMKGLIASTKAKSNHDSLAIDLCQSDTTSVNSILLPTCCESNLSFDPLSSVTAVAIMNTECTV